MLKLSSKYAAIAAMLMIAVIIIPFRLQSPEQLLARMNWGELVGYLTMLLAMGLVYFALREFRDRHQGGHLSFGTGLRLGLLTTFIAAGLFGLATTALYASMSAEQIDQFMRIYLQHSAGPDTDPAQLARMLDEYEQQRELWHNPWFQGLLMFATLLPIGVVTSLASAWLLKRD